MRLGFLKLSFNTKWVNNVIDYFERHALFGIVYLLILISISSFIVFYFNGLGLAYNDARSHLDIGRRVVEGLKPGLAQLGSVWLPLPHILITLTVWNDFMWHSGLAGALVSMISYVITGALIYKFLEKINVGMLGRLIGVAVFALNTNILYLQSTAMTESLLLVTMTAAVFELLLWYQDNKILNLVKAAFFIMLSTLVRYDGWFLFLFAGLLILVNVFRTNIHVKGTAESLIAKYKKSEGMLILFGTLAGLGIFLWFLWNLLIFKDPLYFAFGPYSAHAQQQQLLDAGNLPTKGDILLSLEIYGLALAYNSYTILTILGLIGFVALVFSKKVSNSIKIVSTALLAPLIFNIIALYLGHSVLFIQGVSGNTWFNVRYGVMMIPSLAILIGFLVNRLGYLKYYLIGVLMLVFFFSFLVQDAVTIDDARVGSSQKNVTEVSGWLAQNAKDKEGFILISAASHDAIVFSSGLPMSRFIHEGTGAYWESATTSPKTWARWIIMRTNDESDQTFKLVNKTPDLQFYELKGKYPFADIYELKPEYLDTLITKPVLPKQK